MHPTLLAALFAISHQPAWAASVDTDGDGLDDATEAALGTDPTLQDTDGDRVPDGAR